jgi:hypothetical protein
MDYQRADDPFADTLAIMRRGDARRPRSGGRAGASPVIGKAPAYWSGPRCGHDRAGAGRREGLPAGMSSGSVSGPGRSSAPQMMAPAANRDLAWIPGFGAVSGLGEQDVPVSEKCADCVNQRSYAAVWRAGHKPPLARTLSAP